MDTSGLSQFMAVERVRMRVAELEHAKQQIQAAKMTIAAELVYTDDISKVAELLPRRMQSAQLRALVAALKKGDIGTWEFGKRVHEACGDGAVEEVVRQLREVKRKQQAAAAQKIAAATFAPLLAESMGPKLPGKRKPRKGSASKEVVAVRVGNLLQTQPEPSSQQPHNQQTSSSKLAAPYKQLVSCETAASNASSAMASELAASDPCSGIATIIASELAASGSCFAMPSPSATTAPVPPSAPPSPPTSPLGKLSLGGATGKSLSSARFTTDWSELGAWVVTLSSGSQHSVCTYGLKGPRFKGAGLLLASHSDQTSPDLPIEAAVLASTYVYPPCRDKNPGRSLFSSLGLPSPSLLSCSRVSSGWNPVVGSCYALVYHTLFDYILNEIQLVFSVQFAIIAGYLLMWHMLGSTPLLGPLRACSVSVLISITRLVAVFVSPISNLDRFMCTTSTHWFTIAGGCGILGLLGVMGV